MSRFALLVCFCVAAACIVSASASTSVVAARKHGYLSAPWTPFNADGSLNLKMVDLQAAFHKAQGVTHVWAVGGMGQWSTLTVKERKLLAEEWIKAGKKHDLFVDIHVGAHALADARELALHAASLGANALAIIPPFTQKPGSVDILIECLRFVTEGINLPIYYYHIPGMTSVTFKMSEFLEKSRGILNIGGIKYVDDDLRDFYKCQEMDGGKYEMFWAPEPKLQSMPYGATSFVLAEAYYCRYLSKVMDAFASGDVVAARDHQVRLNQLQSINSAGKYVMKMLGIDLGPPRLPATPMSETKYFEVLDALEQFGFFKEVNTTAEDF